MLKFRKCQTTYQDSYCKLSNKNNLKSNIYTNEKTFSGKYSGSLCNEKIKITTPLISEKYKGILYLFYIKLLF